MSNIKRMKTDTIFAWVLGIVLVAVFIVLAVALHQHGSSSAQPANAGQTGGTAQQSPTSQPISSLSDPKFQSVLTGVPGTSSYAAIVAAQGVATPAIHITDCKPYPQVSAVTIGQPVEIYNTDSVARTLKGSTGSSFSVTVPAKGSTSFTFHAASQPTAFNYTCNGTVAGAIVTSN